VVDRRTGASLRPSREKLNERVSLFFLRVLTVLGGAVIFGDDGVAFGMGETTHVPNRSSDTREPGLATFSHEAFLYSGLAEFAAGTTSFIRQGLEGGEEVLVILDPAKIALLQRVLGDDPPRVRFEDMNEVGLNPARIIPVWRDFVNEQTRMGRRFRGIGEPISLSRGASALVECQRHESLLNLAFDGTPAWRLQGPYDVGTLPEDVIDEALRSHPIVRFEGGDESRSATYRDLASVAAPFGTPLPEPTVTPEVAKFDKGSLSDVRVFARTCAVAMGLSATKAADLVLALNEVATNSLRHGGGEGELRMWKENGSVIGEIRDAGRIDRPHIGRERPVPGQAGGLGVWLANQLCDLVQIRTFHDGSVVRIHMRIA
jgi:anti-sigma regulatory factor (Ser/Thr protein kinase)